jgi:hypothetical protein
MTTALQTSFAWSNEMAARSHHVIALLSNSPDMSVTEALYLLRIVHDNVLHDIKKQPHDTRFSQPLPSDPHERKLEEFSRDLRKRLKASMEASVPSPAEKSTY